MKIEKYGNFSTIASRQNSVDVNVFVYAAGIYLFKVS